MCIGNAPACRTWKTHSWGTDVSLSAAVSKVDKTRFQNCKQFVKTFQSF